MGITVHKDCSFIFTHSKLVLMGSHCMIIKREFETVQLTVVLGKKNRMTIYRYGIHSDISHNGTYVFQSTL